MKLTINNIEIDTDYYVDKWTKLALEATPSTDEEIKDNIKLLYKKSDLHAPKDVVVYRNYDDFIKKMGSGVRSSVNFSVWSSVNDSVWRSVWSSVNDSVWSSVNDSVGSGVWSSVNDSVWRSVRSSVNDSVWSSVNDSVGSGVGFGVWYWVLNIAMADVFIDTKILSEEQIKNINEYKKILLSYSFAFFTDDYPYVLTVPIVRRNNEGQLHSDQRPAVEWENETGQYYLDGVNFTKKIWQSVISQKMSFQEIMQIELADQRAVALKYNPNVILKENSKLLHKDKRGNELYLVENTEINKMTEYPKMYFLKMNCPTGRVFIEACNPDVIEKMKKPNATEAQAWALGLSLSEYNNLKIEA